MRIGTSQRELAGFVADHQLFRKYQSLRVSVIFKIFEEMKANQWTFLETKTVAPEQVDVGAYDELQAATIFRDAFIRKIANTIPLPESGKHELHCMLP